MPDLIKNIPPANAANVLPPNLNHDYFRGAVNHPFRHKDNFFSLVNAWWLAESALLAYADEQFAKEKFEAAGLLTKFLQGTQQGTQCYVAYNDDFVIVTFRGTQVIKDDDSIFHDVLKDICTDAKLRLVDSMQGGNVHEGFKQALDEVWDTLLACLEKLHSEKRERTLWFTGHSLGAALATLAADRYGYVQGLYTFGSPCVGDDSFASDFHVNTYRFVNKNDIVVCVPPFPYVHVGQLKYIDSNGDLHDSTSCRVSRSR